MCVVLGFLSGGSGGEQFGEAFFAAGCEGVGGEEVAEHGQEDVFAGGDGPWVVGRGGQVTGVGRIVLAHVVGIALPGPVGVGLVAPHMRRWQTLHRTRDRKAYERRADGYGLVPSQEVPCSAPTAWAASQVGRSMMAGWLAAVDQCHWSRGTRRPLRRRPITWYPVYFGFRSMAATPPMLHPVAGSGDG